MIVTCIKDKNCNFCCLQLITLALSFYLMINPKQLHNITQHYSPTQVYSCILFLLRPSLTCVGMYRLLLMTSLTPQKVSLHMLFARIKVQQIWICMSLNSAWEIKKIHKVRNTITNTHFTLLFLPHNFCNTLSHTAMHVLLVLRFHLHYVIKPSSVRGGDYHWWRERSRHRRQRVHHSVWRVWHHFQSPPGEQVRPPQWK